MRRLLAVSLTLVLTLGSGPVSAQDGETPAPTGAFEPAGKTKIGRYGHVAAALPDGRVLVIGGMADGGPTRRVEIWDPARGQFDATGGLKTGRMFAAAATLDDGRVLVMGGDRCVLRAYRPTDMTPRKAFQRLLATSEEIPSEPEQLKGGLWRIAGPEGSFGGYSDTEVAIYVTGSGDTIALLLCMAEEAPHDLWLPLAESIEFLPAN